MLILVRRIGKTVMVGNDVAITVLSIRGNQVGLGISAPTNIAVYRKEVFDRIKANGKPDADDGGRSADDGERSAEG